MNILALMKKAQQTLLLVVLFGCFLMLYACGFQSQSSPKETTQKKEIITKQPIQFIEEVPFDSVLVKAKKEGKIIFADFHADWCKPCKEMEQQVFTKPNVADYFNEHFINYKINIKTDIGKQLKQQYRVYDFPSLLFIDHTGETQLTSVGYIDAKMLLEFGEDVMNP